MNRESLSSTVGFGEICAEMFVQLVPRLLFFSRSSAFEVPAFTPIRSRSPSPSMSPKSYE